MEKFITKLFAVAILGCVAATSALGEDHQDWRNAGARLEITSISPRGGSVVDANVEIVATLSYSIADFARGEYLIAAQFDTTTSGRTSDGEFPNNLYPAPTGNSGIVTFKFPLKYIWGEKTIAHPLTMHFFLLRRTSGRSSTVVAKTDALSFSVK